MPSGLMHSCEGLKFRSSHIGPFTRGRRVASTQLGLDVLNRRPSKGSSLYSSISPTFFLSATAGAGGRRVEDGRGGAAGMSRASSVSSSSKFSLKRGYLVLVLRFNKARSLV